MEESCVSKPEERDSSRDTMQVGEKNSILPGASQSTSMIGVASQEGNELSVPAMPLLDGESICFPSPLKMREVGRRQRSNSVDNADLSQRGLPLERADIDDEVYSLPSMDHFLDEGDETVGMTSSAGSIPLYGGIPVEVLGALSNPSIDDDSPAAAALRANAEVHVRKVGKLARSLHAQSVRRLVKRATWRGKSGIVRGKPPRIPPARESEAIELGLLTEPSTGLMYVVREEGMDGSAVSSVDSVAGSEESNHSDTVEAIARASNAAHDAAAETMIESDEKQPKAGRRIAQMAQDLEKIPAEVLTGMGKKDVEENAHGHRWMRRKRKERLKKRNQSYVKGKVINGEHELYALSIAVMLGLRTSICKTNASLISSHKAKRWLSSDDFMATEKYIFSPKGGPDTPPHQLSHTFKFKDYSPLAFAYLRRLFGVNEFDFLLSVCGNANFIEFISNAKSGQFFFYSSDGKYMIKTMTNAESKFLRRILPHYFRHCAQNPNTLMTKFLGMYRVKMYHLRRNVKFVIMNSVYYTDKYLQSFYDLKGSIVGREAKPNQDVKKDNDMRRGLPGTAIALQPGIRERVREQIVSDCEFMQRMKIMDYSMLIGIHHIPFREQDSQSASDKIGLSLGRPRADSRSFRDLVMHHKAPPSPTRNTIPAAKKTKGRPTVPAHSSMPALTGAGAVSPAGSHNISPRQALSLEETSPSERSKDGVAFADGTKSPSVGPELIDEHLDLHVADLQEYEHGYVDDDDSFLEGSEHHHLSSRDEMEAELAFNMEATIEKIYWPFHRYYDIHGYRRMHPGNCSRCGKTPCTCTQRFEAMTGLKLPSFVPPLSDRKDGGFMADMSGLELPLTFRVHGKEQPYEGKIFYMGIIDILQQYNLRKRVEARYRHVKGSGWYGASCVHPRIYAQRFISFFDEYSQRKQSPGTTDHLEENEEQIVFEKQTEPAKGSSSQGM